MSDHQDNANAQKPPKEIEFTIDAQIFLLPKQELTAENLRVLAEPDIGPDRDLYLEGKGHHEDKLIAAGEVVQLKDGQHFFTAPATITPGRAA